MSEEQNAASQVRDFLSGLKTNPNLPKLKALIGKVSEMPGVSQFKGLQIQVLRVQEELLKGQMMIIEQIIEALEEAPDAASSADATPEPHSNGKIIIT